MPKLGKIYKGRGNRWRIRLPKDVCAGDIWCDKQHRSFHSKEHAEYTLAQITGEIQGGVFDPDFYAKTKKSLQSFEVWADDWLRMCERRVALGKLSKDHFGHIRHYVKALFIPVFGKMNLVDIRGKEINAFYLSLERAPKTVFNIVSVLHKMFQDAYDQELVQQIPKFPADLKASELPEPEWHWASEETQEQIFQHLDPEDLFFILFQATHGTRTGETRGLQHQDIDLENDLVTISRAFSGQDLRHTKTKRIRRIPLDLVWKEIYLSRPRAINPQQFVFLREGKPYSRTWAWRKWTEACEKAGVPNLTLYAGTRHSVASQAVNRGVNIYIIAKLLGHSNIKTTERYARLDVNPLRQALRRAPVIPLKKSNKL